MFDSPKMCNLMTTVIMEVERGCLKKGIKLLLEGPIFYLHDDCTKGKSSTMDVFIKHLPVYRWSGHI